MISGSKDIPHEYPKQSSLNLKIFCTETVYHAKDSDSVKEDVEEDSDIELEIYRENHFTPVAPPTTEPLYHLQDDGKPPGE